MNISINEITADQIVGLNQCVIRYAHSIDPHSQAKHAVRNLSGLKGCVGGIFQQLSPNGYVHLPLEKMAGLPLFRVAQGQFFLDGNKRTALLATKAFLHNNGHQIRIERKIVSDLIWGFASPVSDPSLPPRYKESDAIQWVFDNVLPMLQP